MHENKYLTIYHDLISRIRRGEWKAYDKLPSEHELAARYETSRETIRKALHLLSEHGYIQKMKGKGSIVLDVGKYDFPVSGLVSFKELAQTMKQPVRTIVHELAIIKPDRELRQHLRASSKDEVWKVVRVREIGGERIILDKDFFLKKHVPLLTKEICEDSIYEYLETKLHLPISFAKKEMSIDGATDEDHRYLDLNGDDRVVVVKNYVYLSDAALFQYTESRHRLDKFRFVDFARRK